MPRTINKEENAGSRADRYLIIAGQLSSTLVLHDADFGAIPARCLRCLRCLRVRSALFLPYVVGCGLYGTVVIRVG